MNHFLKSPLALRNWNSANPNPKSHFRRVRDKANIYTYRSVKFVSLYACDLFALFSREGVHGVLYIEPIICELLLDIY